MSEHSRRTFLISTTAAAGAAAVAGAPGAPGPADAAPHTSSGAADGGHRASSAEPVVAYVNDDEHVTVMRGEREVVVRDPALARRLSREVD